MSDGLVDLIRRNRPFPDGDIAAIPPDLFDLEPGSTLASYMHFETALARIAGSDASGFAGLLSRDPVTHRYTVLVSATDHTTYSVVAAVRRDAGAREQLQPVLGPRFPPALIASPAAIGPDRALIFSLNGALTLAAAPRVRFAFHWLREVAAGEIQGLLGEDIDSGIEASVRAVLSDSFLGGLALDERGWLRFAVAKRRQDGPDLSSSLSVESTIRTSLAPDPEPLVRTILEAGGDPPFASAPDSSAVAAGLAASAYGNALGALEKKCAAGLSWSYRKAASGALLADCSFDFSAEGLAAYGTALRGDFSGVLAAPSPHTRVRTGALTGALDGHHTIELHLPFLDRWKWISRWDALAAADIEAGEDGSLFTYTRSPSGRIRQKNEYQSTLALAGSLFFPKSTSSFNLSYTDRRTGQAGHLARTLAPVLLAYGFPAEAGEWLEKAGAAGGFLEMALTLSVPGTLAGAWLRTPGERDPNFFDIYSKVSLAVQRLMRRWLPFVYFSDPGRYEDVRVAYPLVFYRSTRPCAGRPRSDFAYDLVSPDRPGVARDWAARPLAAELGRVRQLLIAVGRRDLARYYDPEDAPAILRSIVQQPRRINALLTGDAFLIDRLVQVGLQARDVAGSVAPDPRKATKDLVSFAAGFAALVHRKLRRLYGGQNFVALGSLLLIEATRALGAALDGDAAISGTLWVSAGKRQQTFVNAGYQP
jgi:hypothetical protein